MTCPIPSRIVNKGMSAFGHDSYSFTALLIGSGLVAAGLYLRLRLRTAAMALQQKNRTVARSAKPEELS